MHQILNAAIFLKDAGWRVGGGVSVLDLTLIFFFSSSPGRAPVASGLASQLFFFFAMRKQALLLLGRDFSSSHKQKCEAEDWRDGPLLLRSALPLFICGGLSALSLSCLLDSSGRIG